MATKREWGEGREGRRRINGKKQRCCGGWKKGEWGRISRVLRLNARLYTNVQATSVSADVLSPPAPQEICKDNGWPSMPSMVTWFCNINFVAVVLGPAASAAFKSGMKPCPSGFQAVSLSWLVQNQKYWDSSNFSVAFYRLSVAGLLFFFLNKQGLNCYFIKYRERYKCLGT